MKRKGSKSGLWADHYTQQAKKERYPARSVYKLKEIQEKYRLIQKGNRVLDLGCAPGSWLLYAAEMAGDTGTVVGIDLKPVSIRLPKQVAVFTGDILNPDETLRQCLEKRFHVLMSDMAPDTTGNKDVDAARSLALCEAALSIADRVLLANGSFACKIFQGEAFKAFSEMVKARFKQQRVFKPQSTRKASREIYIVGLGKQSLAGLTEFKYN